MILGRTLAAIAVAIILLSLAGCAGWAIRPGTPGHEPPSGGDYNPVSHERNDNGR